MSLPVTTTAHLNDGNLNSFVYCYFIMSNQGTVYCACETSIAERHDKIKEVHFVSFDYP